MSKESSLRPLSGDDLLIMGRSVPILDSPRDPPPSRVPVMTLPSDSDQLPSVLDRIRQFLPIIASANEQIQHTDQSGSEGGIAIERIVNEETDSDSDEDEKEEDGEEAQVEIDLSLFKDGEQSSDSEEEEELPNAFKQEKKETKEKKRFVEEL